MGDEQAMGKRYRKFIVEMEIKVMNTKERK